VRQGTLRRAVMWLMLVGHVTASALCFLLIGDSDEALVAASGLLPVTATLLTFIVQFHADNFFGTETDNKVVSVDAASLTIVLSGLLIALLNGAVLGYYFGKIASVELLQKMVNFVDTAIAVYLVLLLRRLFERDD
jgi:hypothetical protein